MEIRTAGGQLILAQPGLRRNEAGLYSVLLPSGGLAGGLHRAEVLVDGQFFEAFEFNIQPRGTHRQR